jgi:hypothetical protein
MDSKNFRRKGDSGNFLLRATHDVSWANWYETTRAVRRFATDDERIGIMRHTIAANVSDPEELAGRVADPTMCAASQTTAR